MNSKLWRTLAYRVYDVGYYLCGIALKMRGIDRDTFNIAWAIKEIEKELFRNSLNYDGESYSVEQLRVIEKLRADLWKVLRENRGIA